MSKEANELAAWMRFTRFGAISENEFMMDSVRVRIDDDSVTLSLFHDKLNRHLGWEVTFSATIPYDIMHDTICRAIRDDRRSRRQPGTS